MRFIIKNFDGQIMDWGVFDSAQDAHDEIERRRLTTDDQNDYFVDIQEEE
jgi:hypothetical protein